MNPTTLTSEQLMALGFVAMLLVQGLKLILAKYKNIKLEAKTLKGITAVVALVIATVFVVQDIHGISFSDPMELVGMVLFHVGAVYGTATLMYRWLFKEIADDFGFAEETYLK